MSRARALRAVVAAAALVAALAPAGARIPDKPAPAPAALREYLGEYGPESAARIVFEDGGKLWVLTKGGRKTQVDASAFRRGSDGRVDALKVGGERFTRRRIGPEEGQAQLRITPVRPVPELLEEALRASPPAESGSFRESELVELTSLDPTIRLDVRYATTNNFLGSVFYKEARAFLQRPAAEALVRAHRELERRGYGILVFDGYRPWYVTKVFWEATPDDLKIFVANPADGSRHNRGCAVDCTLYDRATGEPVEMVATYDETTARAYPDYPGGTALGRWHRRLLRETLEDEGFTIYEAEWWHFDYKDWRRYGIGNVAFDRITGQTQRRER